MKKILKAITGVMLVEGSVSISVFPGQLGRMICEVLFGGDNYFSWATDMIFYLFYSGGPVTPELAALIHMANIVAAEMVSMLLIAAFTIGMMMILSSFGISFRNSKGSA